MLPAAGIAAHLPFREYAKRAALAVAFVALAFALWKLANVLILAFAGILFAILILALAQPLRRLHASHRLAVLSVIVLLLGIVTALVWFFGHRIADQIQQLAQQLPSAWNAAKDWLQTFAGGDTIVAEIESFATHVASVSRITGIAWSALGALGSFALVVFIGLFIAWNPSLYRRGIVRLAPPPARARMEEGLVAAGGSLRGWLLGQLVSMAVVAVLTGTGLLLLGVPLAFSLAIIAGLLEFIPLIGPLLGAIPGVLIGFTVDARTALYVFLMYMIVQQVESYLVMPIVQRWAVSLAPALALFATIGFAALFGITGLFFAVPMLVAAIALVRTWYVEPMEGRHSAAVPSGS